MIIRRCDLASLWNLVDVINAPKSAIVVYSLEELSRSFHDNHFYVFNTPNEFREWRDGEHYFRPMEQNDLPAVYEQDDPLTHAISLDLFKRVHLMISWGMPPDCWTKTGWKSLALAIRFKAKKCFNVLCDALPNVDVQRLPTHILPSKPIWLLTLAGEEKYEYGFRRILDHRNQFNQRNPTVEIPPISGKAIYNIVSSFSIPLIDRVAREGLELSRASHPMDQEGPWHAAPFHDDPLALIQILERECLHRLFQHDKYMQTPLFQAVESGNPEVVQRYIQRGVNVNHDIQGETALHCALRQGPVNLDILQILLDNIHVDVSAGSEHGTPLHTLLVCTFGHTYGKVSYVQTVGATGGVASRRRKRPLTAEQKNIENVACQAAQIILNRCPDPKMTDAQGRTTLEMARQYGLKRLFHRISAAPRDPELRWDRRLRPRKKPGETTQPANTGANPPNAGQSR
ncbi:ankyrin repeat-containing domain protein [Aspergillus coremiiformis]|uniref:Ankyrin repeat-containing domain protein n=1 Tax=Aspergillus coremiiformis TaxID=138285 RepID=A0A5N6ZAR7_9EURO|nr:ankyrin repeat-containing domain protein [Aspergillus coremiiformis]